MSHDLPNQRLGDRVTSAFHLLSKVVLAARAINILKPPPGSYLRLTLGW